MKFGVHTGVQETTFDELIALWQEIESLGFDWISVWDHLYPTLGEAEPSGPNFDAIVSMTALALATERVRVGSLVFNVTLRPLMVLAKAVASVDQLSGGRVELGVGAGWNGVEQTASGIEYPPDGVRVSILEESIEAMRQLFDNEKSTFDGRYVRLDDAYFNPKPRQQHLRIWVGGFRPRVLRIAGRLGDGFNAPYVHPKIWANCWRQVSEAAERAGRDPAVVEASVNCGLFVDDSLERAEKRCRETMGSQVASLGGHLLGNGDQITELVAAYAEAGASRINVVLRPPFDREGLRRFAEEVIPNFSP